MALKLKGSTSGFVGLDAPSVAGNNTLILPENSGSAFQLFANDITAGVTTFTTVTVNRNGDLTVPGTISIGGTLTYEDVTSVDSIGIVTARGLSIFGNTSGLNATGVSTFTDDVTFTGAAANITFDKSTDDLIFDDNAQAKFGTGGDLSIYHDSSHSYVNASGTGALKLLGNNNDDIQIQPRSGYNSARFEPNKAVKLYYDNALRFNTTPSGADVTGTLNVTGVATFSPGGSEVVRIQSGGLNLYNDLSFFGASTHAYWDRSANQFLLNDNTKLSVGSSSDLQIYHDTNNSFIDEVGSGSLKIKGDDVRFENASGTEAVRITSNGRLIKSNGGVGIATDKIRNANFVHIAAPSDDYTNSSADLMDGGGLCLQHTDSLASTGRTYPGIFWTGNTSALGRSRAAILGVTESNNDATGIAFLTKLSAGGLGLYPSDERMRLTNAGRLIIGHTTHLSNGGVEGSLQVIGTGSDDASMNLLRFSNDIHPSFLCFSKSRNTSIGSNTIVQDGDRLGAIIFFGDDGSDFSSSAAEIECEVNGTPGTNDMPGRLIFKTTSDGGSSPAESMRIARDGSHAKIHMNTTESLSNAMLSMQTNGSSGIGIKAGATNSQYHIAFRNPNGEVGSITTSGSNTQFNTSSDYRLKENEVTISDAIFKIKQLKPYTFNFKVDSSVKTDGFFAHEAQEVVPYAVTGERDAEKMQSMDYGKLTPLLTAALQEAIAEIETLKTEVAALKGS
ncbi:tail fiber protein [Prochlorococcus phage P-TIM68]|uniref:Peptidase S74 domain-containing protein n=1 Tax=Prochlorococcus phage P-TIM68 TaxID=1542477 RepID=A0A0K0KVF3_9CAUD|nr:tail fiber protein [Prochlorococcus phage P-TIM68]AIR93411.1 hypothetical protein [Prochlorococcus phage P-TIM68]